MIQDTNIVTEIKKEKKPLLNRTRWIIILFILTIINVSIIILIPSSSENETYNSVMSRYDSYYNKVEQLESELYDLRIQVSSIDKTTTECQVEIEEKDSNTISVDISFYSEYTEPIKIDSICTDCVIREVGYVMDSKDIPSEFKGLKLITVKTNEDNNADIKPSTVDLWDYDFINDPEVFYNFLVNQDYSLVYLPEYFLDDDGTFSESISSKIKKTLKYNDEYSFTIGENSTPPKMDSVLEGEKGLYYEYGFFTGFTLKEFQQYFTLEPFDEYEGKTIYVKSDDPDSYYMEARQYYIVFLQFNPSINVAAGEDGIYPITWNDKTINTFQYSYGYEGCSDNYELDSVNIPKEELEISGYTTKTNQPVYEYIDKQRDELKTFYNGYKDFNDGWNDEKILTYEEFIKSHPQIFWEDETGRMIRFINSEFSLVGGCAKPIVYLYPEKQTDVTVKVLPTNGELTFTYPEYDGKWQVTANSNGLLKDKFGNEYEYLWWESRHNSPLGLNNGFVVKYDNLDTFFNLTLGKAGFLQNEIDDFKEYWIPTMNKEYSPYYKISFLQNKEVNTIAELSIYPKPDTEIRIFMVYERLNSYIEVTPQNIIQTERNGFVVTEWGGTRR